MSRHPNQFQTDHFRPTVPTNYTTPYNQMKESQELTRNSATEIDQNDQNPTNAQHHSNDEWPRSDKFY